MSDYSDYLIALSDETFEETPVNLETFLYDKRFLGLRYDLSENQFDIVERGSTIYKEETLIELFGEEEGKRLFKRSKKNLHLMLGKGSGKDYMSALICAYVIYLLLCLAEPAEYYGKPKDDAIDLVNLAFNARMAQGVFFTTFSTRIKNCPWFAGKFNPKSVEVEFDKNITMHSLHSSYEAAEGLNIILAVLDEIDAFELTYAYKVHKALSGTVTSRFYENGKVIALSFPRTREGYMMDQYNAVVNEVDKKEFEHTFLRNDDLDENSPDNAFSIGWFEEEVVSYKKDNWFALRAPTFRVHPTKNIEELKDDIDADPIDALMRFFANPPDYDNSGFFKNHDKLDDAFDDYNGWSNNEIIIRPEEDVEYFIHVDLARLHDRCAVAMGHIESWEEVSIGMVNTDPRPVVRIDMLRYWIPTRDNPVDLGEVRDFIVEIYRAGFNLIKVTFDNWAVSYDMIEYLQSVGIPAEKLSCLREEYNEFAIVIGEQRVKGPQDEILLYELKHLIVTTNGKVDHPKGTHHHNDLSDAVCGAIVNSVRHTTRNSDVSVVTLDTLKASRIANRQRSKDIIVAPVKGEMPMDLESWVSGMNAI